MSSHLVGVFPENYIMRRYVLWFVIVLVIILRYIVTRPNFPQGKLIRITEKVSSEPTRFEKYQSLRLSGIKIYLPLYPEINYGDMVVVEGRVEGNKLRSPKLIDKRDGGGLYALRQKLLAFYSHAFPRPHSSLVAGTVIGSKAGISQQFWDKLKTTGTAHIVVASGMNVTLVAGFLINALVLWLPRKRAVSITLIGIWLYSLFSGFDAPIVRAAIMASITFTAQLYGRIYSAGRALLLSAVAMLIIKPVWIIDLGFGLSFVATGSLVLFQKRLTKLLSRVPAFLREDLATTLAAQIGVAPILYVYFGQFNPLSPIINALVLWTVPPITIIGMVAGTIGLLIPVLGTAVLYIAYPLSFWFVSTINLFAH